MAVLEKIRVKFGLAISIIIALALLSFIIDPSTLESALNSMSSKYDVGLIAGKSISYTDYMADVDRYTTINEILTGSSVHGEQQQQQIRDAAWQELIDKHLFVKNAKAAGLNVGQDELLEATTGNNISPVISQLPYFADENGAFSVDKLVEFVQQSKSDASGRLKNFWNYLQNTVYTQQFYAKYGALFNAGSYQNALEKENLIALNNTTANVDYVMVTYPFSQDSTIVVSDAEIKEFYDGHKKFFKTKANRDIEYVVFEVVPSAEDIAAANDAFSKAYEEFASTDNLKSFLAKNNSEKPFSTYWYKSGELNTVSKDVNDFIFSGSKGASPIYTQGNSFIAAREMASAQISDSVYVKHILLQGSDARQKADSLCEVIASGASFSAVAAQWSLDKNSAADGELGNIGWMTQTYMIPGFEQVITAPAGKPFVLTSQYGTHIVMVSAKTKPVLKKQVAIFEKTTLSSKETFNSFYAQANKFATISDHTLEGYRRAVDSLKIYSHQQKVYESTAAYGAVEQAKELTRWIFDSKPGKASDIITVNNNFFFIAAVKTAQKEGYTPVSEVSSMIRQNLYGKKLQEKQKAEVTTKLAGAKTIEEAAAALGAEVTNEPAMSFAAMAAYGTDPNLAGAAFAAPLGQLAGPVAGDMAAYVYKVNTRETGTFYTAEDAAAFGTQKSQYASQMILPAMMEDADVKDNRARFF